jgi:hypothetical protein
MDALLIQLLHLVRTYVWMIQRIPNWLHYVVNSISVIALEAVILTRYVVNKDVTENIENK